VINGSFPVPQQQTVLHHIGTSGGIYLEFSPAATITGTTVQMQAHTTSGQPINSQTMTVTNIFYWPQGTVPPAFQTVTPLDGWIAPQTPTFTFSNAAPASSFQLVCFHLITTSTGQVQAKDAPVCVELSIGAGGQTSFADGTHVGVLTEIANDPLPPLSSFVTNEHYAWHVVAVDPSGWGIGTTVDVPGYNTGTSSGHASWPWFDTF
jgi:hypothetical protein